MHACNTTQYAYCFSCYVGSSDNSPALCRKHAVRRSPHSKRKMDVQEAKENRERRELEPLFTDSSSGEYNATTTQTSMRQRGGSYSIETHQNAASSFGKEYRSKSVISPTRPPFTHSTTVSELEQTVEMVKDEDSKSDHQIFKEKLVLESSGKVSPVVVKKAMDMQRCRDRPSPLFDDEEPVQYRHSGKSSVIGNTAAAAAAAAAASQSLVSREFIHVSSMTVY